MQKISVENLRGMKNFHHFPKNTPTGYPDLKKTRPLASISFKVRVRVSVNSRVRLGLAFNSQIGLRSVSNSQVGLGLSLILS